MIQYADAPMDLAGASVVTMAEKFNLRTIFTIDRDDFYSIASGSVIATWSSK